jgi:hypothetical protein
MNRIVLIDFHIGNKGKDKTPPIVIITGNDTFTYRWGDTLKLKQ